MTKDGATTYDEAMKLARENFATAKELCDKHSKLDRRIVYGNALITHFDAVCQALALVNEVDQEQPAQQEPVAWINWCAATGKRTVSFECESELASQPLYEGITQNTQYHYSKFHSWFDSELHRQKYTKDHPAYLAAQEAWNAANDAAQHRINRLNAEIEAWKVRFKIAEDALVKINGQEREPVATLWQHGETGRTRITMPGDITDCDARWFKAAALYTSPQCRQWVKLTGDEISECWATGDVVAAVQAKLKEKNA